MRIPLLPILIVILFSLVVDGYIWRYIKRISSHRSWSRAYLISAIVLLVYVITIVALPRRNGSDSLLVAEMWMLYTYFTILVPKVLFVLVTLPGRIPALRRRTSPRTWTIAGISTAIATFTLMWWGALINRLNYTVNEIDIPVANLPQPFDGYRIVQLSDIHTGTYGTDTTYLSRIVDAVNALHPDVILFTGDIVNRRSSELQPFASTLSRLHAPDGVISVLGNHDYGDYSDWPSDSHKAQNLKQLVDLQRSMGWQLLLNASTPITRGTDTLIVVGVENWGEPPFKTYGDLAKAYPTPGDGRTKILLTHNPEHWLREIKPDTTADYCLTLSGHTHAMQTSIGSISPAALRYSTWGGLYADPASSRKLYVNIGLGTVGMPMRIGATPEITLITLRRAADVTPDSKK